MTSPTRMRARTSVAGSTIYRFSYYNVSGKYFQQCFCRTDFAETNAI